MTPLDSVLRMGFVDDVRRAADVADVAMSDIPTLTTSARATDELLQAARESVHESLGEDHEQVDLVLLGSFARGDLRPQHRDLDLLVVAHELVVITRR